MTRIREKRKKRLNKRKIIKGNIKKAKRKKVKIGKKTKN